MLFTPVSAFAGENGMKLASTTTDEEVVPGPALIARAVDLEAGTAERPGSCGLRELSIGDKPRMTCYELWKIGRAHV